MNHVLKLTPAGRAEQMSSYSNPEIPLAPKMVAAIADFILSLRHS
jgi:hypothetical protein